MKARKLWPLPPENAEWELPADVSAMGPRKARIGPACAYFSHNRVPLTSRGLTMFYPVADLLDALDTVLMQQAENVSARNSFAVHMKLPGAPTDQECRDKMAQVAPQIGKSGGFVVTGKETELELLSPSLGAGEFDATVGTAVKVLCAMTGFPVTWFGLGTDAGNSATTELAGPTMRMLKARQAEIRCAMEELLGAAAERLAPKYGLDPEDARDFEVQLPEIGGRDFMRAAGALPNVGAFVELGVDVGAWNEAKAGAMLRRQAAELLDEEFDPEDIPDAPPEKAPAPNPFGGDGDEEDDPNAAEAADMEAMREKGRKAQQARRR
jgi:hypothetical protein